MTPNEFHKHLLDYPRMDKPFVDEVARLGASDPYCQLFPVLWARTCQDRANLENSTEGKADASVALHRAAVFTADRTHLRELLEAPRPESPGTAQRPLAASIPGSLSATVKTPPQESGIPYADRVMESIRILREHMEQFESMKVVGAKAAAASKSKKTKSTKEEPKEIPKSESTPVRTRRSSDPGESLLHEIKTTHKKQKPENDRQVEQLEIIEQFIKTKPEGSRLQPPSAPAAVRADLAQGFENYSENVISETLVDILIRQGKKNKAIEVLKRLIWKFPQKKALFAARIQELSQ